MGEHDFPLSEMGGTRPRDGEEEEMKEEQQQGYGKDGLLVSSPSQTIAFQPISLIEPSEIHDWSWLRFQWCPCSSSWARFLHQEVREVRWSKSQHMPDSTVEREEDQIGREERRQVVDRGPIRRTLLGQASNPPTGASLRRLGPAL